MHRLQHKAKAQVGRLLRVLFLRLGAVSTDSGPARRRAGRGVVLCLVGDEQPDDANLARLAQQQTHQFARWWIPFAAILAGLFVSVSLRTAGWESSRSTRPTKIETDRAALDALQFTLEPSDTLSLAWRKNRAGLLLISGGVLSVSDFPHNAASTVTSLQLR